MERENYLDMVQDKSTFEEGAGRKIEDRRDFEQSVTKENKVTENGLRGGKSITDKLKESRYETVSAEESPELQQTQTELHQKAESGSGAKAVDATDKEEYVSSNLFQPVVTTGKARLENQSYMAMLTSYAKVSSGTKGKTGKYETRDTRPEAKDRSYRSKSFQGNQVQGADEAVGKYAKGNEKTATKKDNRSTQPINKQERISRKDKGSAESKKKAIDKTKASSKEAFGNKVVSAKTATGKYRGKIGSGKRSVLKNTVKESVKSGIRAKAYENADENVGVEGVQGTRDQITVLYRFFHKEPVRNATGKYESKVRRTPNEGSGKYTRKASVKSTSGDTAKRQAVARKKAQQRNTEKKFRNAKKKEKALSETIQEGKQKLIKVAKKLQEFIAKHFKLCIVIAGALILIIVLAAALSSCAMAFSSGSSTYVGGLSPAEDVPMTGCENYYTEKEMKLQERMDKIQEEYPNYDEYVLDIAEIGHDATKMMAYLSSRFESYDLSKVQGELDTLFDEMYILTITPVTETRTRQVYNETTKQWEDEDYEWKILYITLEKKDWDTLIAGKFSDPKEKELYDIYIDTGGAHQAFYNPFTVDWTQHISSEFGWRIHPILGYEKFHNGVDIALPSGTEIHACTTGKVIQAGMAGTAGNYVVVQDETGYTCHYMHLSSYKVNVGNEVRHGDIIGKVGSTGRSTGPHLHLGVKDAGGKWLNPRFLVSSFPK